MVYNISKGKEGEIKEMYNELVKNLRDETKQYNIIRIFDEAASAIELLEIEINRLGKEINELKNAYNKESKK